MINRWLRPLALLAGPHTVCLGGADSGIAWPGLFYAAAQVGIDTAAGGGVKALGRAAPVVVA